VQGDFSTGIPNTKNLIFQGTVDLNNGTRTITGIFGGSQVHFSGIISNGGVTFTTNAAVASDPSNPWVAFIYDGNNANTYQGLTTVDGKAILVFENTSNDGAVVGNVQVEGNGVVDYIFGASSPGQIADTATVTVNSPGNTNVVGLSFDGLELRNASDTIGTLNGNSSGKVGLGSGTLTVANGGNFAGVIEDGAFGTSGNLTVKGGTLIVSGANTYTGLTTLNVGGTLQAAAQNTFSNKSSVIIEAGGTLDLNNFDQTVGEINDSINNNGAGTINLGTATLTTGNNNIGLTTFSGVIQGTGGLTKIGTGTLIIAGNANTFTGHTTVNGGAIALTGSSMSPVFVNNNALFELDSTNLTTGTGSTPVTVNAGGTFQNNSTLTVTGAGSRGTQLSGGNALVNNPFGASITGDTGVYVNNTTGIATIFNRGTIKGTGGFSVDASNSSGGVTIYDFGKFIGQSRLGTGTNTVIIGTKVTYSPMAAGPGVNDTLRLVGADEDTLKLTDFPGYEFLYKVGGGQWNLTGNNPFTRGTLIDGGTLNVQGTLASNTTVRFTGTLAGTGTVAGNVLNNGLVTPGTPTAIVSAASTPGTLSVKGNYTQSGAGTLGIMEAGSQWGK
jgi:autotransporter-associated beta strand protein